MSLACGSRIFIGRIYPRVIGADRDVISCPAVGGFISSECLRFLYVYSSIVTLFQPSIMVTACSPTSSPQLPSSALASSSATSYSIYTSLLFSPSTLSFHSNLALAVSSFTGLITAISKHSLSPSSIVQSPDLDLRGLTVLPGFVDAHTHTFLHSYGEASSLNQERDESLVERTLRASNHCRAALKAGYTTYRDLGTEGVFDADVGVRDAINRGIIPGPRLFVATEALASSGSYALRYESRLSGTSVPRISDPCDGIEGVMAGVRRRIGAGADIIKFYADYRRRTLRYPPPTYSGGLPILHPPEADAENIPPFSNPVNPVSIMWSHAEMDAIVAEAGRARAPVAAHAIEPEAVIMAAKAGVTTIEHGYVPSDAALDAMKQVGSVHILCGLGLTSCLGWDDMGPHTRRGRGRSLSISPVGLPSRARSRPFWAHQRREAGMRW